MEWNGRITRNDYKASIPTFAKSIAPTTYRRGVVVWRWNPSSNHLHKTMPTMTNSCTATWTVVFPITWQKQKHLNSGSYEAILLLYKMSSTVEKPTLLQFETPTLFMVCGPTNSGKTWFVKRILENAHLMFKEEHPTFVLYCYGSVWKPMFGDIAECEKHMFSRRPSDQGRIIKHLQGQRTFHLRFRGLNEWKCQ